MAANDRHLRELLLRGTVFDHDDPYGEYDDTPPVGEDALRDDDDAESGVDSGSTPATDAKDPGKLIYTSSTYEEEDDEVPEWLRVFTTGIGWENRMDWPENLYLMPPLNRKVRVSIPMIAKALSKSKTPQAALIRRCDNLMELGSHSAEAWVKAFNGRVAILADGKGVYVGERFDLVALEIPKLTNDVIRWPLVVVQGRRSLAEDQFTRLSTRAWRNQAIPNPQ